MYVFEVLILYFTSTIAIQRLWLLEQSIKVEAGGSRSKLCKKVRLKILLWYLSIIVEQIGIISLKSLN